LFKASSAESVVLLVSFVDVVGTVVRSDDDDDECSVVEEVEEPSVIRLVVL